MASAFSIEHSIDRCADLWSRFSPRRSLYDLWEFRLPFWEEYTFEPSFVVLPEEGMLPLWFHPEQKRYLWFGDTGDEFNWAEDASIWMRDAARANEILSHAPRPCMFTSCTASVKEQLGNSPFLSPANPKSVLPLKNIASVDAYLETFPKKLRSNLRHDQRVIEQQSPTVTEDHFEDLEAMIGWNRAKFPDSPWNDEKMRRCLTTLVSPSRKRPYDVHVLSVRIGGVLAAVDCLFSFNGTLYPLFCGSDIKQFPGIGHFMNLLDIQFALDHGMTAVDFAETEPGTIKEKLFPLVAQYTLRLE